MADIILIQPRLGEMDFLRTKPSLPLGLLSASSLVSQKYRVSIIDQRIDKDWKEKLAEELRARPLCVGITSYTGTTIRYALEASRFVKEMSGAPVVWGGIHASLLPKQTLGNKYVDIVVQGEGEYTFLELADAIKEDKPFRDITGLWFKEDKKQYRNPPRAVSDLNILPGLPYHLVNVENYTQIYKGELSLPLETSRGCIYGCAYCYNTVYHGSNWRCLSAQNTVKRVKYLIDNFKIKNIYLIDDNFFVDLKRGKDVAENIISENLNIKWQVQGVGFVELDKMDDDYFKLLEKSGCVRITCGVESGSSKIRKMLMKGSSLEKIVHINRKLSPYKMAVLYSFISGFPGEKVSDLRHTIRFMFKLLRENAMARNTPIYQYVPYPGTFLFEKIFNEGFNAPDSLEGWKDYDFHNANVDKLTYLDAKLKKLFKSEYLYFLPFFTDNKFREYQTACWMRILVFLYKPVAVLRLRCLFFKFPLERAIIRLFIKLKEA